MMGILLIYVHGRDAYAPLDLPITQASGVVNEVLRTLRRFQRLIGRFRSFTC